MGSKGQIFSGVKAGRGYDLFTPLFGMGRHFFRKAVAGVRLEPGMRVLDLGCGTGKLTFALAANAPENVSFFGCDYSPDQLARAEKVKQGIGADITFMHGSMDELDFDDAFFDLIMSSMALHAVNPGIRRAAIANAARMLQPGGRFLLADIAAPRPGVLGTMFSLLGKAHRKNAYDPDEIERYFEECGFMLTSESYLNSLVKKQLFKKDTKTGIMPTKTSIASIGRQTFPNMADCLKNETVFKHNNGGKPMKTIDSRVTIRKAGHKDCAEVKSIALAAYAIYLDRMDVKPFPMLDDYSAHIGRGNVYILEDSERMHGYVVLIMHDADTLLLDNIAVRPEDKGMGFGHILARFAEEQGRTSGCKRICLYTNEVMTENILWYERLGYAITHQAVENGYRRIYMAKDL